MFVILVYDINEKRVAKVLKIAREYLTWIQNSVFEGEISEASFKILKDKIKKKINPKEDSVIFYILRSKAYTKKEILGQEKGGQKLFI
ncbi:CRISPR-associated endonuclease Cas2 [Cellulosilyticum ruminicola]|uniref:CRISPR-associated endonuclease Cas2 n=1 Tax=Cellulosilyticum ruminicola TaxID=425254 RepID=UPI0006D1A07E|nr:CRISPR-associated endonuclease Cas2 [Cellulosilyticum ruminicola]